MVLDSNDIHREQHFLCLHIWMILNLLCAVSDSLECIQLSLDQVETRWLYMVLYLPRTDGLGH